jgi:hypothetical protein
MLAEFALTPSVFDEDAHDDKDAWLEQLRELGGNIFPRVAASPVMVSNLYAGSWHSVATQVVMDIKDHRARKLCQDLLEKTRRTLVFRPVCNDEWPGEEECAWGREAIQSASEEAIERIIATRTAHEVLARECTFIRSIDEVTGSGFWQGVSASRSVPMRIGDQSRLLRKLCLHTEFLCLLTPRIYGASDDETDFAIEVIRSALKRPSGYRRVSVDIHTSGPSGDPSDADYSEKLSSCVGNISTRLGEALRPGESISLYVWPRLLDRYIVGGIFVEAAGRVRQRSPRWGVSMQHIARRDERTSHPATSWNLLDRKSLSECFDQYFRENATGVLPEFPIQVKG